MAVPNLKGGPRAPFPRTRAAGPLPPAAPVRDAAVDPPAWIITPALVARAEAESVRLFDVVREGTYPSSWPVVAWLVKLIAGGRCEHCGREGLLAVHHLDRDKQNLQHWNLVALCWQACHLWVETHLSLDRDQLDLFGDGPPAWLAWRLRDRERWPLIDRAALAPSAAHPAGEAGTPAGTGRPCACGCGRPVTNAWNGRRRLYFSPACRQRVHKERRLRQLSLFPMSGPADLPQRRAVRSVARRPRVARDECRG